MLEIGAVTLQHLLETGSTLALLDVREHGEYNSAHIPGASSLPRRLLEHRIERLVPGKETQIVVCDDTGIRARLAAQTLERLGYRRVAVLDGGLNGWASDNRPTEWGMNVPSKDFGEKVEVVEHVPSIEARELHEWIERGDDLVILDTRTPEEYSRFCIPGGRSVPNGELPYRIGEIVRERPNARVVVNCAGRTRSIIGTRALQRMGLKDVVGLKNGTSGWVLAGLTLETGADRLESAGAVRRDAQAEAEAYARRVMAEDGVQAISADEVAELARGRHRRVGLLRRHPEPRGVRAGPHPRLLVVPRRPGRPAQRRRDRRAERQGRALPATASRGRASRPPGSGSSGIPNVSVLDGGTAAWEASGRGLRRAAPTTRRRPRRGPRARPQRSRRPTSTPCSRRRGRRW